MQKITLNSLKSLPASQLDAVFKQLYVDHDINRQTVRPMSKRISPQEWLTTLTQSLSR